MGALYGLVNKSRKEVIKLHCKYLESAGYAKFITWLSFEWNKEEWYWVHDNNSSAFPEIYYEYYDMTDSYICVRGYMRKMEIWE